MQLLNLNKKLPLKTSSELAQRQSSYRKFVEGLENCKQQDPDVQRLVRKCEKLHRQNRELRKRTSVGREAPAQSARGPVAKRGQSQGFQTARNASSELETDICLARMLRLTQEKSAVESELLQTAKLARDLEENLRAKGKQIDTQVQDAQTRQKELLFTLKDRNLFILQLANLAKEQNFQEIQLLLAECEGEVKGCLEQIQESQKD